MSAKRQERTYAGTRRVRIDAIALTPSAIEANPDTKHLCDAAYVDFDPDHSGNRDSEFY